MQDKPTSSNIAQPQMSELQTEKDVNLNMADLNINKDHETTEAASVSTSQNIKTSMEWYSLLTLSP